jgi:prepilin peptidase CpaA
MHVEGIFFVVALAAFVIVAACADWRMHRIPNYITIPAALMGVAYHVTVSWVGHEGFLAGLDLSLRGFALGLGLLLIPWLAGGGGAGDVKLLAALGAWLGWQRLLIAFVAATLWAAVFALVGLIFGSGAANAAKTRPRKPTEASATAQAGRETRFQGKRTVPFAVPVALGTGLVLLWLVWKQGLGGGW